ncbi:uncharacterized protein NEMAJ01_0980 [Nematocida major]|uniref:uncharacterized protein n=1 Tax=Nematocida major TaxID=1912982 RepID=UPI002007DE43|nr:uncharacterized protein NEMAJ01_0980 [Nematocida major]KAH9386084.1 hypothetical protein NEMAJ01_0980 [Nematocida major]
MLVEVLDGIGGSLVYIEKSAYTEESPAIAQLLKNPHRIYAEEHYTIIRLANLFRTPEISSLEMEINSDLEGRMKRMLKQISCMCGCSVVENKSALRLPSDGWEELVDMWSCHNREFAHLAEREIRPKKDGVLYSTLHLLIEPERAPKCLKPCESTSGPSAAASKPAKLFYNQMQLPVPDEYLLFHYVYDLFQTNKEISVGDTYTICLLDTTHTYAGELTMDPVFSLSMKIGYAHIEKTAANKCAVATEENAHINEHYTEKLIEIMHRNSIKVEMNGRPVTFIRRVLF